MVKQKNQYRNIPSMLSIAKAVKKEMKQSALSANETKPAKPQDDIPNAWEPVY